MRGQKKRERGRPTLESQEIERVLIRISLTLHEGEDDDLIDWFDSIPDGKRANLVKTALRQGGVTHQKEVEEVDELISDDYLDELLAAL